MSDLYLRRAVRRAHIRALQADWSMVPDAGMASPMIRPLDLSRREARVPFSSNETSRWPICPISYVHGACPRHEAESGALFFYAKQYPSPEQSEMLAQKGYSDFFEGGNPPPSIWAAFYRVLIGEKDPVFWHMVYAYRFHHCPSYREGLLQARQDRMDEEELLRKTGQMSLDQNADMEMGGMETTVM